MSYGKDSNSLSKANIFKTALEFTLKWEGKYVNHINDAGGATNFGISLPYAEKLKLDKDKDGDTDAEDIKLLTIEDAVVLYKRDYWDANRCGDLPFPLSICAFDSFVNHSPNAVRRMLKEADGDWKRFIQARKAYYGWLVKENPRKNIFMRGWLNRANDLAKYCEIKTAL